ncbi:hypothetical protein VIGAN_06087700 [Vigna angularis var. angularis]|uniref:Uncharacterized protein n=1 Tax=Vigna angularis var. angularis TaxID=157739 RepID=A0A0S3SAB6_PHAAN|nr:hypothetical protein VIGAN_06087700 [Vigna angularis var. angularis]
MYLISYNNIKFNCLQTIPRMGFGINTFPGGYQISVTGILCSMDINIETVIQHIYNLQSISRDDAHKTYAINL